MVLDKWRTKIRSYGVRQVENKDKKLWFQTKKEQDKKPGDAQVENKDKKPGVRQVENKD